MPPELLQRYRCDPVKVLIKLLNMFIGNLDQYSENKILEALPKIEEAIEKLPIDEFVKPRLYDILWASNLSVGTSLRTIVTLLSNPIYIN